MRIGERLKLAIQGLGLSIKEASGTSGVPYRTLQDYLGLKREPSADILARLCTQLRISGDWLLTGEGDMYRDAPPSPTPDAPTAPDPTPAPDLSPTEAAILALYRDLDGDAQREIQNVATEKKRLRDVEQRIQDLQAELIERRRSA